MAMVFSNGTGGGNWSSGSSWTLGSAPAEGDVAVIKSTDTITFDLLAFTLVKYAVTFDTTDDHIELTSHGFANGTIVRFSVTGGSLPAELSSGTDYYIINAQTNTFQVATTRGGTAINFTDSGSGTMYVDAHVYQLKVGGDGKNSAIGTVGTVNTSTDTITISSHGLSVDDQIEFSGTPPTGITAGNIYFVHTVVDSNSIKIKSTLSGSVTDISGSQSGASIYKHTCSIVLFGILDFAYNIGASNDIFEVWHKGHFMSQSGGNSKVGTNSNPLENTRTLIHKLNYTSGTPAAGKYRMFAFKKEWFGTPKTLDTLMNGAVTAGNNTIVVDEATNWRIGDIIVISDENSSTMTEEFTISNISGTTITLSGNLAANKADDSFVMMCTSNVIITNQDTSQSYVNYSAGTNAFVLSYVTYSKLGVSGFTALSIDTKITNTNYTNVIFAYNTYKVSFLYDNVFDGFNSYLDRNAAFSAGNSNLGTFKKLNVVKPTSFGTGSYHPNTIFGTVNLYDFTGSFLDVGTFMVTFDKINARKVLGTVLIMSGMCKVKELIAKKCGTVIGGVYGRSNRINKLDCNTNTTDITDNGTRNAGELNVESYITTGSTNTIVTGKDTIVKVSEFNGTSINKTVHRSITMESDLNVYRTSSPALKILSTSEDAVTISSETRTFYVTNGQTQTLKLYAMKDVASTGGAAKIRIAKGSNGHGLTETNIDGTTGVYSVYPTGVQTTCTMTIASPCVVTLNNHGYTNGDRVSFFTSAAGLPTGITAGKGYIVANADTNTFTLLDPSTNNAVNTSGSQSGTHKVVKWEEISHNLGTASSSGFVTLELFITKGGTTWNLWIDDLTITPS